MSTKIFIFALIFPFFLFSQTWKATIDLDVEVSTSHRLDLYTNKDGNHVLTFNGNTLVYRLFSYNGNLIRSNTIATGLNEDARFAKISGYGGYIYISYKNGNKIYTKRSNNAGQTWSNMQNITMSYSQSNGIDLWSDGNGLHLTYSEYNNQLDRYDTYYRRLPHKQNYWIDSKKVTDNADDQGGFPSVTTSSNRVHVAYTQGTSSLPSYNRGITETRDKYNSTWQNPIQGFDDAMCSKVIATSSKLHLFYYDFVQGWGQWYASLYYKNKDFGASTWPSTGTQIYYYSDPDDHMIDAAVTENDILHILYDNDNNDLVYRNWNNGVWSSPVSLSHADAWYSQQIAANGNDIYVIWNDSDDETIYLKQCDYPPIAPRNVSISPNENDHPLLQWDANPEADLRRYRVYRLNHDPDNFIVYGTSFVDEDVEVSQSGTDIEYCVKAEDWYGNLSDASDQVGIHGYLGKRMVQNPSDNQTTPKEYKLYQNYPNPFNPITKIRLDLPKESFVSLVVLNINGQFVKRIFKGFLDAGKYQFPFDGSSLPSGIYIYRLKAKNYVSIKKMILTK